MRKAVSVYMIAIAAMCFSNTASAYFSSALQKPVPDTPPQVTPLEKFLQAPSKDVYNQNDIQTRGRTLKNIENAIQLQEQRHKDSETISKQIKKKPPVESNEATLYVTTIIVDQQGGNIGPDTHDIISRYLYRRLTRQDLLLMTRDLTNRYVKAGFSTTLMALDLSFMQQEATVVVKVLWGRVGSVTLNGEVPKSRRKRLLLKSILPNVIGRPLNMRQIDQAVENLNNGIILAKVNIRADEKEGYSVVEITTKNEYYDASIAVNNSGTGTDKAGRWTTTGSVGVNGPLGNGDKLNLSVSQRFYYDYKENFYYTVGGSWSVPWRFFSFSINGNASFYKQQIKAANQTYVSDGQSMFYNASLSRVISRSSLQKTTVSVSMDYKGFNNYFERQRISVSSRNYSLISIGANRVQSTKFGTLYGDISADVGVPLFNSQSGLDTGNGIQRSWRLMSNISWSQTINVFKRAVSLASRVGVQYSPVSLPSVIKFYVGHEYTVRGFSYTTGIDGDTGFYIANTLSCSFNPFAKLIVVPSIGVDYGATKDNMGSTDFAQIASASVGSRFAYSRFFSSITFGFPMYDTRGLKFDPLIWFGIGLKI